MYIYVQYFRINEAAIKKILFAINSLYTFSNCKMY